MSFYTTVILLLIASHWIHGSQGMIIENGEVDPELDAQRALLDGRRDLSSGDRYIARVYTTKSKTSAACARVLEKITEWEDSSSMSSADVSGDEPSGNLTTVTSATVAIYCNVFFQTTSEALVEYVASLNGVQSVELDEVVPMADVISWGLDRIDQESLPLSETSFGSAYHGRGSNIYVVDTGLYYEHSEFTNRSSFIRDFTYEEGSEITDGHGHGTHCSGIAAGTTYGVAKEAYIFGIKVLNSNGWGYTSDVIKGIAYAVQYQNEKYNGETAVLSLSLGGAKSSALKYAVLDANTAGMITVVAAGNKAKDACLYSPSNAGGSASDGGVITVGATDSDDSFAYYSNFGACVDVLAPGSYIKSSWIGSTTATRTVSGTSMATPFVAGVAATLLEKHNKDKLGAQAELVELLAMNQISGLDGLNTTNGLLQVSLTTAPPTSPTVQATIAPTTEPITLCVSEESSTSCVPFYRTDFGPDLPRTYTFGGQLEALNSPFCKATKANYTDKVIIIPFKQSLKCSLYSMVKLAENQGASAVILYPTYTSELISPLYSGYDAVNIVSVIITEDDAKNLVKLSKKGAVALFGSQSYYDITKSPSPRPTKSPTSSPTMKPTVSCANYSGTSKKARRKCLAASYCIYDSVEGLCYNVEEEDIPCTAYDESSCSDSGNCVWTILLEQQKKAACYNIGDVPYNITLMNPRTCSEVSYDEAEEFCSSSKMTMCAASELMYAGKNNVCDPDKEWVWSSTSCGKNKFYQIDLASSDFQCKSIKKAEAYMRCCNKNAF